MSNPSASQTPSAPGSPRPSRAIAAAGVPLIALEVGVPVESASRVLEIGTALGAFHVVLLHFPIGFLVAAACLELWGALRRQATVRPATTVLLALGATTAVAAAASGWLLADTGGYDDVLLDRHRWLGVATAVSAVIVLCLRGRASLLAYRVALATCVAVMLGAGHVGGMLTHGRTTPYAMLADALRHPSSDVPEAPDVVPSTFVTAVAPILEGHCVECHGPDKQKHGLRLDSREAALKGGESGKPAIVPGNAMASVLVEVITLPRTNERAMPPDGKARLKPEDIVTLIDWINRGADWDVTDLEAIDVEPASADALKDLRAAGFQLGPLARGNPLMRVGVVPTDAHLAALRPIAEQVAWLDLSGKLLEVGEIAELAAMSNLTRLELQRSSITDDDLRHFASLHHLAVLNLYGTEVGDAGLEHLRGMASLRRVYLWGTRVSDAAVEELRKAVPGLHVELGG